MSSGDGGDGDDAARKEGVFRWLHGPNRSMSFTRWGPGEPNNHPHSGPGGDEDCAEVVVKTALWNDCPCDHSKEVVCQFP